MLKQLAESNFKLRSFTARPCKFRIALWHGNLDILIHIHQTQGLATSSWIIRNPNIIN